MKYKFEISETFSKIIEVEADNLDEATDMAYDILGETPLSHDYICEDDKEVGYEGNVKNL